MSVLMQQHEEWRPRRRRLMSSQPQVVPVAETPRPVSPFVRERQERAREQRAEFERMVARLRATGTVAAFIDPAEHGWPAYVPPVAYDHCEGPTPRKSIRQIALEVVAKHGITLEELLSPRRATHIVRARQEAFWRCKQETSASFPQIGRHLGNKDHTTVLHGIKMYEKRLLLSGDKSGIAQQG